MHLGLLKRETLLEQTVKKRIMNAIYYSKTSVSEMSEINLILGTTFPRFQLGYLRPGVGKDVDGVAGHKSLLTTASRTFDYLQTMPPPLELAIISRACCYLQACCYRYSTCSDPPT